jgi:hypothetical protein
MNFNPSNFLYHVKQLVTGVNGDLIPNGVIPAKAGNAQSADGGIQVERPLTFASVTAATGTASTIATLTFPVTRDYDETSDHLRIRLVAVDAGADAGVTITGTPTFTPIATGTSTTGSAVTATAPFSTTSLDVTTTLQVFEINLSGNGLHRDDTVSVAIALAGTTTHIVTVYWIEELYDSTIVSFHEDTTGGDGSSSDEFGFPLR